MNNASDPITRQLLNEKQKSSKPLTDEQREILAEELARSVYKEITIEEILDLLNLPREIPNPEPQGTVAREFWAPDELKNVLMQSVDANGIPAWIKVKRLAESDNLQIKVLGELILDLFTLRGINLQNPMVAQGLQTLRQIGVLDDALYEEITTVPDPGWRPTVVRIRAEELFGEGAFVERGDLI